MTWREFSETNPEEEEEEADFCQDPGEINKNLLVTCGSNFFGKASPPCLGGEGEGGFRRIVRR